MFVLLFVLLIGAHFYVFWRLWHLIPPVMPARVAMLALGVLALLCCVLYFYFVFRGNPPHWLGVTVYKIGMSWVIILLYLFMAFLLMDILRLTGLVSMPWMRTGSWPAFATFSGVIFAIMLAGNLVYHNKKRSVVEIKTQHLAPTDRPIKIVAVSDLHLGHGIGPREFSCWVDMINAENPDIVLMAGDVIDTALEPLYHGNMADIFHRFKAPVYIAPGNHEFISGIEKSTEFFQLTGATFLRDSSVLVDNMFYVVGRDDQTNSARKPLAELVRGLDRSKPIIVLDHQPTDLSEVAANGVTLQLSGHTHLGQVWPISWITKGIFEKAYGYTRKEDTHYYISSGLGIWGGKFRIGTRSEYVVIEMSGK